ncbi:MAG: tetratricopeptide repeat protein [Chroococcidiopsidaceae cyanobacterium CP_BM_ER_R8_30]|nr:tetratricopeptide repeat protein [Chroococcidiopsidaceae cyanobacterium CP_BM_ER_R8_30]
MNLSVEDRKKTFSILSIGQRGVGKTVFLAGSYTELHSNNQTIRSQKLWFDCKELQEQEKVENLLNYIANTGHYPPSTMKITDFNFSLKSRSFWGERTICHFRWWEIPGEICQMSEQDFREMVSASHSCCMFVDADALMHDQKYPQRLEEICELTLRIAFLVSLNDLNDYAFAVILTKCDKLDPSSFNHQQLEQKLQSLIERFDQIKANYRVFYSHIPIVCKQGTSTLDARGAAAPLVWLVWELSQAHALGLMQDFTNSVSHLWSSDLRMEPLQDGSLQSLFKPQVKKLNKQQALTAKNLAAARRNRLFLILAIVASVGFIGLFSLGYSLLGRNSLTNSNILQQRGLISLAIPLMEKLVQREPSDIELRLQLAELYQSTGQLTKAETIYDSVLAQQKDNLKALVGKATTCASQGDMRTAKTLFARAEAVAPTNIKAKVHALAQKTLESPAQLTQPNP